MRFDDWNRDRTLQPLLAAALAALTVIIGVSLIIQASDAVYFVDTLQLSQNESLVDWFPLTHLYTNGYLLWRLDAVTDLVSSFLGITGVGYAYLTIYAIGAFTFSAVALREELDAELFRDALISGGCAVLIGYIFGFDTVVLASIVWLPWYLLALYRFFVVKNAGIFEALCLFAASVLLAYAANQYVIVCLLSSFYLVSIFCSELSSRRLQLAASISIIPAILVFFDLGAPSFPAYQEFSHVVPHYGTTQGLFPLIGPELPFPVINRAFVRDAYLYPALALLLAGVGVVVRERILSKVGFSAALRLGLGVVVLALCIVLDSNVVSSSFNQIGPLAAISRLIPGAILAPLSPLALALGVTFLLFACKCIQVKSPVWVAICTLFVLALLLPQLLKKGSLDPPLIRAKRGGETIKEVVQLRGSSLYSQRARVVNSPSLHVLRDAGLDFIDSRKELAWLSFEPLARFPHIIEVSGRPVLSANLTDEDESTRWHMPMKGHEFIKIRFELGIRLRAVKLSVGSLHTDFPRGLKITAYPRCEHSAGEVFFETDDFQGRLTFSPDGFPVYGAQSDVTAIASQPHDVLCLTIEQTGSGSHFDWSVAEIEVAAG